MQLFICKCRFNCYLKVNWPLVKSRKIIRLPEAWAKMYRKVLVTFLKTIVLANIVQVITSDHNCSLHFHLHYYARQDSSTNAHVASKRTFLVNVMTLRCLVIQRTKSGQLSITNNILLLRWHGGMLLVGGHWLLWMERRPAGWLVCLPLLIFHCTIQSRSSLLALAHPGGPRKRP